MNLQLPTLRSTLRFPLWSTLRIKPMNLKFLAFEIVPIVNREERLENVSEGRYYISIKQKETQIESP